MTDKQGNLRELANYDVYLDIDADHHAEIVHEHEYEHDVDDELKQIDIELTEGYTIDRPTTILEEKDDWRVHDQIHANDPYVFQKDFNFDKPNE